MSAQAFEGARPGAWRGPAAWWRRLATRLAAMRRGRVRIDDPYVAGPSHPVPNAETVLQEALGKINELTRRGALDEGNGQVLDRWLQQKTLQWHTEVDLAFSSMDYEARSAVQQAAAESAWRTSNVEQLEDDLRALEEAITRRRRRREEEEGRSDSNGLRPPRDGGFADRARSTFGWIRRNRTELHDG